MIYETLNILINKLNDFISNKYKLDERIILLGNASGSESEANTLTLNKLVMSLVNIERDTSMGINFKSHNYTDTQLYKGRPPLNINLYVIISANFVDKNYDEAIKYISTALEFVQSNDLLTKYNTPDLDSSIMKLHLEYVNIGFTELSNLWSIHGGNYHPSFLLKIKMLTIDKQEIEAVEVKTENVNIEL